MCKGKEVEKEHVKEGQEGKKRSCNFTQWEDKWQYVFELSISHEIEDLTFCWSYNVSV